MRTNVVAVSALVVATMMTTAMMRPAAAAEPASCPQAYESSQQLKKAQKLRASREALLKCVSSCKDPLLTDCTRWLGEVDTLTPTIRVHVVDAAGERRPGVAVLIDDDIHGVSNEAIAVDPGSHRVQVQATPGSTPGSTTTGPVQVTSFTTRMGERDHEVTLTISSLSTSKQPPTSEPPAPSTQPRDGKRTVAYVVGAIGLGLLAGSGALAIKGHVDRSDLKSTCAPKCAQSDADEIATLWWIAAGFAAAGTIATGVAAYYFFFTPPAASDRASTLTVGVRF